MCVVPGGLVPGCCRIRRLRSGISTTSFIGVGRLALVVPAIVAVVCALGWALSLTFLVDLFFSALVLSPNAFRLRAGGAVVEVAGRSSLGFVLRVSVRLRVVTVRVVRCPVF